MTTLNKTIASAGIGATLLVGGIIGVDLATTTPQEILQSVVEKTSDKSSFYGRSNQEVKQALGLANALYARREKGDEPTAEEWSAAETLIDQMRAVKDSPQLQKVDRLLEVEDADIKYIKAVIDKLDQ